MDEAMGEAMGEVMGVAMGEAMGERAKSVRVGISRRLRGIAARVAETGWRVPQE